MTNSEYPDLSRWPDADIDGYELSEAERAAREKLAELDPRDDMFHLNPHIVWDRASDGSVTLSVPWSECRFTAGADASYEEAVIGFSHAYDDVLQSSPEELSRFTEVMRTQGVVPLSERPMPGDGSTD